MIYVISMTKGLHENSILLDKNNSYISISKTYLGVITLIFNKNTCDIFSFDGSSQIVVKNTGVSDNLKTTVIILNSIINNTYMTFFSSIKFSGKGFRLSSIKSKKAIEPFFGYSHVLYLYAGKVNYKRIRKNRYFFWFKSENTLFRLKNLVNIIKPINIYTLRGLRTAKKKIVKRKGRKSPSL